MRHSDRGGSILTLLIATSANEGGKVMEKKEGKRGTGKEGRGMILLGREGVWVKSNNICIVGGPDSLPRNPGELPVPTVCSTNKRIPPNTHTHTTPQTTMHPHAVVMSLITIKMSMTASKCACVCQQGFFFVCVYVCEEETGRCRE